MKPFVPNKFADPKISQLVTTYQRYSHSRSFPNYKSGKFRWHFGKIFTESTIVSTLLPTDLSDEMKKSIISERERILSKVKKYIDKNLFQKYEIF